MDTHICASVYILSKSNFLTFNMFYLFFSHLSPLIFVKYQIYFINKGILNRVQNLAIKKHIKCVN